MAWTDLGKAKVMDEGIDGATRYVSLHLTDDTELSGHGYARKAGVHRGYYSVGH